MSSETITRNDLTAILNEVLPSTSVDYVVEEGTSGEWTYRKWNSGKIEAWAYHSFGSQTGTAWASQWYKDMSLSLPSGLFASTPIVLATSANNSWSVYGVTPSATSISMRMVRNASSAAAMAVNFYAMEQ